MARIRTAKALAKRIDLSYFKRPSPLRSVRKLAVLAACAGAMVWVGFAATRRDQRLFNPGPVSVAHARFEQNCSQCHTSDAKGGFLRSVSDNACLACHEAPLHHPNQLVRTGGAHAAKNGLVLAAIDPNRPDHVISSSCAECHVEHRGRAALAALDDRHCTQCHQGLAAATKDGKPRIASVVTAFVMGAHPRFGQTAREGSPLRPTPDGGVEDTTVLRFNHRVHLPEKEASETDESHRSRVTQRCMQCHSSDASAKPQAAWDGTRRDHQDEANWRFIPVRSPKDPPEQSADASARRYMTPIRFDRHCAVCHELELPASTSQLLPRVAPLPLSHSDLAKVRLEIEKAIQDQTRAAASFSKETEEKKKVGNKFVTAKKTERIDESRWLKELAADLSKKLQKRDPENKFGSIEPSGAIPSTVPSSAPSGGGFASAAQLYTTYTAFEACAKCHDLERATPAAANLVRTTPTGVPTSPRRWFVASQFDHRAHRDMNCLECHAKLSDLDKVELLEEPRLDKVKQRLKQASSNTREVLSPDIQWEVNRFIRAGEGYDLRTETRSCTECHHRPDAQSRGAPAACVTCHQFHDHSRELYPDGQPTPRGIGGKKSGSAASTKPTVARAQ